MYRLIFIFWLTNAIQANINEDSSLDLNNATGPPYRGTCLSMKTPSAYRESPIAKKVRKFTDLIEYSDVFIDKTLLIKELFERNTYMIVLTAPSKWGKSVILDMLRRFFELQVDPEGLPVEENPFRSFFVHGELTWNNKTLRLREPPLISKHSVIVDRYQGRFPVVYVDFNSIFADKFADMYENIRGVISQVFLAHKYIINVLKKASTDVRYSYERRAKFAQDLSLYENFTYVGAPTHKYMDLTTSLKFLTRVIWEHFHKKIIVLIDDYDIAYKCMLVREKFGEKDAERIWRFFTDLITTTFFGNGCLKKAIVTGTFHVGRSSSFVSRIAVYYDIVNNPFYKYFGFSSADVTKLLEHFNLEIELRLVQIWYNSYHVGENLTWTVYHPPSVIEYLQKQRTKVYYTMYNDPNEADLFDVLLKIKPLRSTFESLLNKERKFMYRDRLCFSREGAYKLKKIARYPQTRKIPYILYDQTLAQLAAYGYVAFTGYRSTPPNGNFDNSRLFVAIANVEMMSNLVEKMWIQYSEDFPEAEESLRVISQALAFYVVNDDAPVSRLEETFPPFMRSVGLYANTSLHGMEVKDHVLQSMLNYLCLRMRIYYKYKTTVFNNPVKPKMTLRKDDFSVIVGVKCNFTAQVSPLELPRSNSHLYKDAKRIKLIGIEFLEDGRVRIQEEKVYPRGQAVRNKDYHRGQNEFEPADVVTGMDEAPEAPEVPELAPRNETEPQRM